MQPVLRFTLLFLLIVLLGSCTKPENLIMARHGVLDLRSYRSESIPVKLRGQWLFSWQQFVTHPENFKQDIVITVPGTWSDYTGSSMFQKNTGYCSYGLKIMVPAGRHSWSMVIPAINSAYRLYLDGKLKASAGKISTTANMLPAADPQVIHFTSDGRPIFLSIQVSNYHFVSGGIWGALVLGTPTAVANYQALSYFNSAFLIGSLLIIGIYHFCIFLLRRKDKSPFYFAMICFFIAIRESFGGPAFFFLLEPSLPYALSLKILYFCFPVCILFFTLFFSQIFPDFSKFVKWPVIGCCILYILLILFTGNTFYGGLLSILSVIFSIMIVYLLLLTIREYPSDPARSILIITGISIVLCCFINDILFESGLIQSYFLLPLGFFAFTICQSILLAIRFSKAFRQSEQLGLELLRSEELKSIEKFKNQFFANITHEFRTPLMLILSPLEQMILTKDHTAAPAKSLETIHRNATNLLQLINQLLDLSKLDSGNMKSSLTNSNIKVFFRYIIDNFKGLADVRQLHLKLDCKTELQELLFDWEKMEKISYNLVMNAIKFTPPHGNIDLKVTTDRENLFLKVADSGQGIPAEKLDQVFERFVQLETNQLNQTGTGIGLSLVKELVIVMKGEITVISTPGKGTEFMLRFPLPDQNVIDFQNWSSSSQGPVPVPPSFTNLSQEQTFNPSLDTILLVEDNEELSDFIMSILIDKYNILYAPDGQAGWELCCSELPGLVLSDIMMPKMDGISLCRLIKETAETDHIGVILLTAKSAIDSKLEGLSSKANDYLTKPFNAAELLLRIENFFSHQHKLKEYYRSALSSTDQEKEKPEHPFLLKLYQFIESNLDNSQFGVEELAACMAVSSRTLHRKLSALLGCNPNETIKLYRLQKATDLLGKGYNVSETAYQVGFESASYFGQCFKEVYQSTPSEYQSRL